jgi:molybdenum cofactor cytidylyltransferase
MGQLKALLKWHDQPLFVYQVEQLLASPIERLVVVLGHRADGLQALLPADPRLCVVINPDYASGKVSSIIAGVSAVHEGYHVLILGVDQPRPASTAGATIRAHLAAKATITVAGSGGRRGHPVLFAPSLRPELLALSEETEGLRAVLTRHADAVQVIDTGDPLTLVNLNTPADYEAALLLNSTSSVRAGNQ